MTKPLEEALDLLTTTPTRKGPECTVAVLLRGLSETTAAKVLTAIDNHEIPATRLAQTLADHGMPLYVNSIRRHRNRGLAGGCACK